VIRAAMLLTGVDGIGQAEVDSRRPLWGQLRDMQPGALGSGGRGWRDSASFLSCLKRSAGGAILSTDLRAVEREQASPVALLTGWWRP
jgi:hypothetical protein